MRIKDLEFRINDENRSPEIVKWYKRDGEERELCYTLMFFQKDSEGYNASFISYRPFEVEEPKLLWELMKYAQRVLDARFEFEDFCITEAYTTEKNT